MRFDNKIKVLLLLVDYSSPLEVNISPNLFIINNFFIYSNTKWFRFLQEFLNTFWTNFCFQIFIFELKGILCSNKSLLDIMVCYSFKVLFEYIVFFNYDYLLIFKKSFRYRLVIATDFTFWRSVIAFFRDLYEIKFRSFLHDSWFPNLRLDHNWRIRNSLLRCSILER